MDECGLEKVVFAERGKDDSLVPFGGKKVREVTKGFPLGVMGEESSIILWIGILFVFWFEKGV